MQEVIEKDHSLTAKTNLTCFACTKPILGCCITFPLLLWNSFIVPVPLRIFKLVVLLVHTYTILHVLVRLADKCRKLTEGPSRTIPHNLRIFSCRNWFMITPSCRRLTFCSSEVSSLCSFTKTWCLISPSAQTARETFPKCLEAKKYKTKFLKKDRWLHSQKVFLTSEWRN